MSILPHAVLGVLPGVYIFPSEETPKCRDLQMKWNINGIKPDKIQKFLKEVILNILLSQKYLMLF